MKNMIIAILTCILLFMIGCGVGYLIYEEQLNSYECMEIARYDVNLFLSKDETHA